VSRHLVIGATGQVGQALMAALEAAQVEAIGTGHTRAAGLQADLGDPAALSKLLDDVCPAMIWLVGAYTHVDGCEEDEERSRRVNFEGPARAAAWAGAHGAGLAFFSTDYVFDGTDGPYGEEAPTHPLSVYGRDKRDAEEAVLSVPRGLVLRTAWVYSWEAKPRNFCQRLAINLRAGKPATIPADQWGNPTYAPDLAAAALALWQQEATGLYHAAGEAIMTRAAFAVGIADAFGLDPGLITPVRTADLNQRAPRPLQAGLRLDRLRHTIGSVPRPPDEVLPLLAAAHGNSLDRFDVN
jgi:dTDP-4-dehydrorhamnose reductase